MSSLNNESRLMNIARQIFAFLPGEYRIKDCDWQVYAIFENYAIWISEDRDRLNISSSFPEFREFSFYGPDLITVSQKKSFARIAKDIQRRLMPQIEKTVADLLARKQKSDDQQVIIDGNVAEVLKSGVFVPARDQTTYGGHLLHITKGRLYGQAFVSLDTINLHIDNIPVKIAFEIIELLKGAM